MTDAELTTVFASSFTRGERYRVWHSEDAGNLSRFIYLADEYDLFRIEIVDGKIKILDTSDCTYEIFDLADPTSLGLLLERFEIDESAEPKPIEPIEDLDSLVRKR